jgi:Kelch motif protein
MRMRFARGSIIAIATGLVLSGGAALAAGASPDVAVKFKSGVEAPFAGTRFDGAVVNGKVYFLGFRLVDNTTDGSIWTYDIASKTYKDTKIDMPVPVSNYTVAVLKDSTGTGLYVFGGRDNDGASIDTVQVFYPKTGKAKVVKSDPWPGMTPSDCISLPGTGVAVAGNKAYVMGGMSFSTSVPPCVDDQSKEVWSFDPKAAAGKKWSKEPSLKVARGYISPAVVGGNTIYAIGGDVNDAGTLTAQTTVESWKIGASKWQTVAKLPEGCDESQAFAFDSGPLGGTITLAGCGQWPNALPDVLQYNVKGDKWSTVGALKEARRNQAGMNIGTASKPQLMVLGGYSGDGSTVLSTSEIGVPGGKMARVAGSHLSLARGAVSAF